MPTAAQYQHRLDELDLGPLDQPNPPAAALSDLESQLQQMAQDVVREIQVIRAQYHSRISSANAGGSSRILTSNKQTASAGHRAEEVARLEAERDEKIAPYQEIRQKIDDLVARLSPAQR